MSHLSLETLPLSRSEVDYPPIREMHDASSLGDGEEVRGWRCEWAPTSPAPAHGRVYRLEPSGAAAQGKGRSLTEVVRKRGSTRAFDRDRAISFEELSNLLESSMGGVAADGLQPPGATSLEHYLIVHAVSGLPSGRYYYRRGEGSIELLEEGCYRAQAGHLGLDQSLPADAAVNIYSLCDLPRTLAHLGNRGYRVAQLEGGIIGGRLYVAAYAQGLGATGLTFFDDEVTEFFSPHAAGKSVMFLTAIGHADRSALRRSG
jgi:nitroreductase